MTRCRDKNIAALEAAQPFDSRWVTAIEADERGRHAAAQVRTQSASEIARWLDDAIGAAAPTHLAVVGATRPETFVQLDRRAPHTRILLIESSPEVLRMFLDGDDWTGRIEAGRLFIVGSGASAVARRTWPLFGCTRPAPLLLNPRLARRVPAYAAAARGLYNGMRFGSPEDSRLPSVRRSMLHAEVIVALEQAASVVLGGIVEIGAYVGGGTAALGRGLRSTGHRVPFLSIDAGGQSPNHPDLPSDDIIADRKAFVESECVADRVTLLKGRSDHDGVRSDVARSLGAMPIGLLTIDADGRVFRDLRNYLPLCRTGALIVVDDYQSAYPNDKTAPTTACIDAMVAAGVLEPVGVYGWGTWFGVLKAPASEADIQRIEAQIAA